MNGLFVRKAASNVVGTPLMQLCRHYTPRRHVVKNTGIPETKSFPIPWESMKYDYLLNKIVNRGMHAGAYSFALLLVCPAAIWGFATNINEISHDLVERDRARWSKKPEAFVI